MILLIGIVKKNAINMIHFAIPRQRSAGKRNEGQITAAQAIYRAARLRLRPILMTTTAAMLGAVPLAIGHGDGAELRLPLGIAVAAGLVMSQWLMHYTTPVLYVGMDWLRAWGRSLRWPAFHSLRRASDAA